MPKESINHTRIYYESHGEGFPLVLSYGLGGSTRQWAPQVPALSRDHQLILWDPRGHGQSDSPRDESAYGMDVSAADLLGLVERLNLSRAHVGGLSMGGGIATRFTLAHPERVAALLIIDSASASGAPFSAETVAMREKTIELALNEGMEAVARHSMDDNPNISWRAERDPEAAKGIMDMYLALDPVGYAHSVRALLDAASITDRLQEIRVPTLVLVGAEDPALPAARLTHEKIPGSKLVVIPDASHLSNLDQPDAFNREVSAFLSEVDGMAR